MLSSFTGTIIYPRNESQQEIFEQSTNAIASSSSLSEQRDYNQDLYKKKNWKLPIGEDKYKFKSKVDKKEYQAVLIVEKQLIKLKKGSECAPISNKCQPSIVLIRKSLLDKKVLSEDLKLTEDYPVPSVSTAGVIVVGHSLDGWLCWLDKNGKVINQYRKKINNF